MTSRRHHHHLSIMLRQPAAGLWHWLQGGAPSLDEQAAQYGADSIAYVDDLPGILSKNSDRRLYALPSGEKHAQQLTEQAGCGEAPSWSLPSAACKLCCAAWQLQCTGYVPWLQTRSTLSSWQRSQAVWRHPPLGAGCIYPAAAVYSMADSLTGMKDWGAVRLA